MTNLKENETKVTVGDRKTFTEKKWGDWHGCKKRDRNIHHVKLTNTAAIPGLHANLFSGTQALQKYFQLTSEVETLIHKKNQPQFVLTRKWRAKPAKDFYGPPSSTRAQKMPLFWTPRRVSQKVSQPSNLKGRPPINKKIQQPNKTWHGKFIKISSTKNLGYTREDRMCTTTKHLHYRMKGELDVCEECATVKTRHNLLHKVAEERIPHKHLAPPFMQ